MQSQIVIRTKPDPWLFGGIHRCVASQFMKSCCSEEGSSPNTGLKQAAAFRYRRYTATTVWPIPCPYGGCRSVQQAMAAGIGPPPVPNLSLPPVEAADPKTYARVRLDGPLRRMAQESAPSR